MRRNGFFHYLCTLFTIKTQENMKRIIPFLALAISALAAEAKVVLPSIYTDNMVLQQQRTLTLKGKAKPQSEVSLKASWSRTTLTAKADGDGMWSMELSTPKAGGPYTLSFNDGEELTLKNVMVGEVWLGSGQSNMEMPMSTWGGCPVDNYEVEIKNANYPDIRLFQVKNTIDKEERDCFSMEYDMGGWQECHSEIMPNYSAMCYFFALHLYEALKVPVGIISSDWGGTPFESWTRSEIIENVYNTCPVVKEAKEKGFDRDALKEIYNSRVALANRGLGAKPGIEQDPDCINFPSNLWNAMIAPLRDFPLQGFIWYQGCSNVGNAPGYEAGFQAMIEDWRAQWKSPEMPFYFVQLANFLKPSDLQPESQWALLREAQAKALALKGTGMAVNIDLGDEVNIHPGTKRELARRLSRIALNQTYGQKKVAFTAPIYQSYRIEGNKMHILFNEPAGCEPFEQNENLPGFIVAGADRKWHVAKARTEGNEVIVSCPEVKTPLAARYGWADNPTCILKTKSNLHVAPFRTDNW